VGHLTVTLAPGSDEVRLLSFAFESWMVPVDTMPLHDYRQSECISGAAHPSTWHPKRRDGMYAEMDDPNCTQRIIA
jgi:hypothetical protein